MDGDWRHCLAADAGKLAIKPKLDPAKRTTESGLHSLVALRYDRRLKELQKQVIMAGAAAFRERGDF